MSKSNRSKASGRGRLPGRPPATRRGATRRRFDLPVVASDLHPTAVKLLDAAWKVYEASGWDGLSFYAIGQEAGVSPSLVWYHFGSKNELLVVLADWIFHGDLDIGTWRNGIANPQSGDPWELLAEQCRAALHNLPSYRLYFDMLPRLLNDEDTRSRLAEGDRNWSAALASIVDDSGTDPGLVETSRLLATLMTAMTDGLAIRLLADPDCVNVDEMLSLWKECLEVVLQRHVRRDIQS
ncbi:MAG: TetR/AcrR family transcriptional regulator [Thermoleophilia bacterium]